MNTGLKHFSFCFLQETIIPRENQRPDEYGIETDKAIQELSLLFGVKIRDRMNTGLKHSCPRATEPRPRRRENQRPDEYGIETVSLCS